MFRTSQRLILALITTLVTGVVFSNEPSSDCQTLRQFTFSWQFVDQCKLQVRGGTSTGAGLTLDKSPSPGWLSLQEKGLSDYERDRRAILAMAGGYRTSFDFLEVVGYTPEFTPDPPYQSWGTEYVYVVEDRGDFISLQHIMVMEYVDDEGKVSEPFVQKHWRQDWQYQKRDTLVYAGNDKRQHKQYSRKDVKGTWAQSVWQVDDSLRYEAIGKWRHEDNFSTWISDETWRPVPRRESSLRKDYQVLIGTNRHTITPSGWVQEEENYKTVLADDGSLRKSSPYLSKELGVNRYERLKNFDFKAGDVYWNATNAYWRDVRNAWTQLIEDKKSFELKRSVDGMPLFMPFFQEAEKIIHAGNYDAVAGKQFIDETLSRYVE